MLRHACGFRLANDDHDTQLYSTTSGTRISSTRILLCHMQIGSQAKDGAFVPLEISKNGHPPGGRARPEALRLVPEKRLFFTSWPTHTVSTAKFGSVG